MLSDCKIWWPGTESVFQGGLTPRKLLILISAQMPKWAPIRGWRYKNGTKLISTPVCQTAQNRSRAKLDSAMAMDNLFNEGFTDGKVTDSLGRVGVSMLGDQRGARLR